MQKPDKRGPIFRQGQTHFSSSADPFSDKRKPIFPQAQGHFCGGAPLPVPGMVNGDVNHAGKSSGDKVNGALTLRFSTLGVKVNPKGPAR
jgi:hypothetical protein